jgi:dienelactone hydrolase
MKKLLIAAVSLCTIFSSCKEDSNEGKSSESANTQKMEIVEEALEYNVDTVRAKSFIAYDKSIKGKRPMILVIPEWWGLGDYVKMRTRELAKLGYFAMGVDIYGNGAQGRNPEEAGKLAAPFYKDQELIKVRLAEALARAWTYPQADRKRAGMMGYCFGGYISLMAAKIGLPLKGVVSFHGSLAGTANNHAPILICHGEADNFVPEAEVAAWRKSMDSLGANYTFKSYPGATHAFTNPNATEKGKEFKMPIEYNAAADTASWNEMKAFFGKIFPAT